MTDLFLRVFKHLLPTGRAWRLTVDKTLRRFFAGLAELPGSVVEFFDLVWLDIDPRYTRQLDKWDETFGLRRVGLSESARRDRLAATWAAMGGQSPRYIQDTLQAHGFDVYVHEWWEPGSTPPVARNPLTYLRNSSDAPTQLVECAEPDAECGETFAEAGNSRNPLGYPLVNKIWEPAPLLVACGEPLAECGELTAEAGNSTGYVFNRREYTVTADTATWPYFLYIGGKRFGDAAIVPSGRREEFEDLCLKICPLQQWLGILVTYN